MTTTYRGRGDVLDYVVASTDITSGTVRLLGNVIGIAQASGVVGETVAMSVSGVHELPAETPAAAIAQGATVYWDDAAGEITATASGNQLVGYAAAAKALNAATILVRLAQTGRAAES